MSTITTVSTGATAAELRTALDGAAPGSHVAIVTAGASVPQPVVDRLAHAIGPGAATASPVPAGSGGPSLYDTHPCLPPAPSLAVPCADLCVLSVDAVSSLGGIRSVAGSARDQVVEIGVQLLQRGWRHVAAPGVAHQWDPTAAPELHAVAAWSHGVIEDLVGDANAGLETHRTWAAAQVEGVRVVVDGACVDGDLHTGTQLLVIEVTRQLQLTRPDATVLLAVPSSSIDIATAAVADVGVTVVERTSSIEADVMYRPYQMLRADELDTVMSVGRRRLVGQLDMIGFANPFYHPSPQLFRFARNLQREMMRNCDGVTFISAYGRDAAIAECPELVPTRLHVVSCGADPEPTATSESPRPELVGHDFLLCLSATFWHKNRAHAIATFAELVATTGYEGMLVVAGPEPFYGRSNDDDDSLLASLPADVRDRVLRIGRTTESEKWWLLQHASAVLYPSVLEGFGLVPFEAAVVGTPCLAFAGTAPGEVLGSTTATIATWDRSAWAARIATWLADPVVAADAVAEVAAVADVHTWRACALRTWDAIDATLAQPSRSAAAQDGGGWATVDGRSRTARHLNAVRFTVARTQPAVARRAKNVLRLIGKRR